MGVIPCRFKSDQRQNNIRTSLCFANLRHYDTRGALSLATVPCKVIPSDLFTVAELKVAETNYLKWKVPAVPPKDLVR
jgi:hypothetical protein